MFILMCVIAVTAIILGLYNGIIQQKVIEKEKENAIRKRSEQAKSPKMTQNNKATQKKEEKSDGFVLSLIVIVAIVIGAAILLVIIYFFRNVVMEIMWVLFGIGVVVAFTELVYKWMTYNDRYFKDWYLIPTLLLGGGLTACDRLFYDQVIFFFIPSVLTLFF